MALAIDFSLMHVAILLRYVYNIGFFGFSPKKIQTPEFVFSMRQLYAHC